MRWRSTSGATARTSSGVTKSRPSSHACARAQRSSAIDPRGLAELFPDWQARGAPVELLDAATAVFMGVAWTMSLQPSFSNSSHDLIGTSWLVSPL